MALIRGLVMRKKNFKRGSMRNWKQLASRHQQLSSSTASAAFGLYVRGVDSRRLWHTPSARVSKFLNGSSWATRSLSHCCQPIAQQTLSQLVTAMGARGLHWEDRRCCIARTELSSCYLKNHTTPKFNMPRVANTPHSILCKHSLKCKVSFYSALYCLV